MPTIKDYSIIETEWIDNWIKTYEDLKYKSALPNINVQDIMIYENYRHYIYILKEIKSKLKPLTNIVENAFNATNQKKDLPLLLSMNELEYENVEDYINNTIIE
jgi:hypothetical protein